MCLGIPMRVLYVDGLTARCEAKGTERDVSLFLMQEENVSAGDFLVMQGGYATQKITPEEAAAAWEIYDRILAAEDASVP